MTTLLLNLITAYSQDDSLGKIANVVGEIEENMHGDWLQDGINAIAIISIVLASWSLYIAYRSLVYTRMTVESIKNEADKDRIDNECQKELFLDIIRHLYRNKVCTLAMQAKLKNESWNGYPSDEHFLKLQLLPSDIHLEQYYKDSKRFQKLHNIELLLRNYNTEIEVARMHISDKNISLDTKKRDFDTLNLKPGLLTNRIVEAMDKIWPKENIQTKEDLLKSDVSWTEDHWTEEELLRAVEDLQAGKSFWAVVTKGVIKKAQKGNVEKNDEKKGNHWDKNFNLANFPNEEKDHYVTDIIERKENGIEKKIETAIFAGEEAAFKKDFETDVMIECGTNKKGEEKIYIIKY